MLTNPNLTKDISHFVQRGSSPLEVWYSGMVVNSGLAAGTQAVDFIRAHPFFSGVGGNIDRLSFEVTVGAALSVGRVGIFKATSETNIYPNELIVDSGQFDCSVAGVKTATISVELEPNTLYWIGLAFGVAAPTVRLNNQNLSPQVFGFPATLGASVRTGLAIARAYAALPATFPAGAFITTGGVGIGWVRFAAV